MRALSSHDVRRNNWVIQIIVKPKFNERTVFVSAGEVHPDRKVRINLDICVLSWPLNNPQELLEKALLLGENDFAPKLIIKD